MSVTFNIAQGYCWVGIFFLISITNECFNLDSFSGLPEVHNVLLTHLAGATHITPLCSCVSSPDGVATLSEPWGRSSVIESQSLSQEGELYWSGRRILFSP